ncbi:MAG TPA: hypothetical protein VJU87_11040 [Gemmatimonadaceae bacterium]|nr:hypothetical protein [Gemmatimonadaceae bacterium]
MTRPSGGGPQPAVPDSEALQERRANSELRRLIEEMLERVREMNRNVSAWSGDQRARAEAELEAIMARVRRLAAERPTS